MTNSNNMPTSSNNPEAWIRDHGGSYCFYKTFTGAELPEDQADYFAEYLLRHGYEYARFGTTFEYWMPSRSL